MPETPEQKARREIDDFQDGWFGQHGSLGRAYDLFAKIAAKLPDV